MGSGMLVPSKVAQMYSYYRTCHLHRSLKRRLLPKVLRLHIIPFAGLPAGVHMQTPALSQTFASALLPGHVTPPLRRQARVQTLWSVTTAVELRDVVSQFREEGLAQAP